MELIRSNRTENLADALASRVRDAPSGPFDQEAVVVQSRGMERWLTLALAERLGIWANPLFPFPRAVIERILEDLSLGRSEEAKAYDPKRLKWTIAELLRKSAPADLQAYLGDCSDADRILRLATSVSNAFDRYVVNRSGLLGQWAKGPENHWQAELWRGVASRLGPHDLASRITKALPLLGSREAENIGIKRLHLFSLETLPPLFLEFFSVLSQRVPTVFYLLEPSSEYVSDISATPQLSLPIGDTPSDGHPLLTSLGRLARDFQQLLLDVDEAVHHEADSFEGPIRESLLSSLQADILEFRSPPKDGMRETIDGSDQSISIHACTGPMREVQVLHDLVRGALEDDRSLRPEHIVVMTPDLDTYAPIFRAVFSQDDEHRIPYEVHDRKTRDDASFYDDLLSVLEVLDSRFSVLDMVRLMDASSLRDEFQFTPEERSRLTELLEAAGVRWGIDAEHREQLGFPAEPLHTWRAGLGRLFLGFASMPDSTEVFEGLLPRGAPSLGDVELVSRLSRLCELLFDFHGRAHRPLEIDAWVASLAELAVLLFAEDDESGPGVRNLRSTLETLRDLVARSGYGGTIPLKTLRRELGALLTDSTPAVGFLRRGVTLTELVPLRSVPFRIVCLLGMSEDSFPRADDRPSFDLTRVEHRRGDRNKRDDDRHSFLQAILCTRDRMIITYSAPATALRSGANPSPVVWDLCETARRYYQLASEDQVLQATSHPLHAFDSKYFTGSGLPRSASRRYLEIAQALALPSIEPARIELRTEVNPEETNGSLSVGELGAWLWNPMTAFVERVLRARFSESDLYEPTRALTELGPLEASKVGNGALRACLRDEALEAYLKAAPEFPDGSWGALERQQLAREIRAVDDRQGSLESGHEPGSALVAVELDGIVLEGRLDGLRSEQRLLKRFTKPKRRAELLVWIEHLLMQTAEGLPSKTRMVLRGIETRATLVTFDTVADPRGTLKALIDLYQTSRTAPLPLVAKSSLAFAEKLQRGNVNEALAKARKELQAQRRWDPYLNYVLGVDDPFDDLDWSEAFQRVARQVYTPFFRHRSEE
jgi:exodeoxyribonuclease V gamma subunit